VLNWFQTIIEVARYLWPFRIVHQWERGVVYVCGRCIGTVPPFVYPIIPFFTDVKATSVVPGVISTPLLTVTTRDNKSTITFSAAATVRISDASRAWNKIDNVSETMRELLAAVTAEKLAEVDPARLDGDKRKRLIADMVMWLNRELEPFGLEVLAVRFTNFAVNMKAFRLMTDTALLPTS